MRIISKCPTYFLIILHVCFGFDCGFVQLLDEKYRRSVKYLQIITSVGLVVITFIPVWGVKSYIYLIAAIQYAGFVTVLSTSSYKVYNFLNDIHNIKTNSVCSTWIFDVSLIVYTLFTIALVVIYINLYSILLQRDPSEYHLRFYVSFITLSTDFIPIIEVVILREIYVRFKYVNAIYVKLKKYEIQQFYVQTADCWDKIRPLYLKLVIVSAVTCTPKLMYMLWYFCVYVTHDGWVSLSFHLLHVLLMITHISVPSILVQMVKSEMKFLTTQLNNILVQSSGKPHREMYMLAEYMKRRSILDDSWNIPIDLRLPCYIFNMSATYLIVIIQFTHIY